ncbi:hypothetical protein ADL05_03445 [Nocardiopsis sp. NRRL B-16309]|nr:hypothetical protein ADL05_03445 [Nocardiopsis sp. NRRL B-16309]
MIAGGVALGLVPSGPCGAAWWRPMRGDATFGWYSLGETPDMMINSCGMAMAPAGSWAIALIVSGAALVAGVWFHTAHRPTEEPKE